MTGGANSLELLWALLALAAIATVAATAAVAWLAIWSVCNVTPRLAGARVISELAQRRGRGPQRPRPAR
jgi:hypothetical protein